MIAHNPDYFPGRGSECPRLGRTVGLPGVRQVYPTANKLPENLLRLYLHFNTPMSRGVAHRYVDLRDHLGNVVKDLLVEPEREQWDPEGKRLTLLLDPESVGTESATRDDSMPILAQGKKYQFHIKPGWPDAAGNTLSVEFEKRFAVGPSKHDPIALSGWELYLPTAGTLDPFFIRFPRVMDHALLGRAVSILDRNGRRLAGRVLIGQGERCWAFHPQRRWGNGKFFLAIDSDLEDVAGNRIAQSFEFEKKRFRSHSEGDRRYQIQFTLSSRNPSVE